MREYLIEIIGIACGVSIVMSQSRIYAWFVNKTKQIKPFSCEMCMTFWVYIIYSVCNYPISIHSFLSAFICAYLGYLTSTKFLKW